MKNLCYKPNSPINEVLAGPIRSAMYWLSRGNYVRYAMELTMAKTYFMQIKDRDFTDSESDALNMSRYHARVFNLGAK